MGKRRWFLFLIFFLSACVSTAEPTETPFSIQHIATTPEWEGLVSLWLTAYVQELAGANLKLELLSSEEILSSMERGSVVLGFMDQGVPEGWFATPMKREAIVVIVNPEVRLESLQTDDLADIFSGRVRSWEILAESSGSIQPIVPLPSSISRERFTEVIMGNSAFDPSAIVGSTPDAVLELVKSEPGAIGFIPAWRLEQGVNSVTIAGVEPRKETLESGAYPLWVDILAISPEEPVGLLRDFLVWLQGTYLLSQEE